MRAPQGQSQAAKPYTAKNFRYRKRSQALQTVYDTVYESETIRRGYDIRRSRIRPTRYDMVRVRVRYDIEVSRCKRRERENESRIGNDVTLLARF